ncbi:unnamed protein product [Heligmosomoides polygyrus]|uniref:SWI/SNF complex subunit SWI3B n=1 Tax=Heligmosomoides polygyrus TaxID=6339 RepID=A0A183GE77_HELPZ|nr:unnamed protein product [Heligmosomoides polygyrus]
MNMHEILQYPVENAAEVAASYDLEEANSTVVVSTSTTSESAPVDELSTEASMSSPNVTESTTAEAKDGQPFKEVTPPLNPAGMLVARSVGVEQQLAEKDEQSEVKGNDQESGEFSSPAAGSPTTIAVGPMEVTVGSSSDNGEKPTHPAQASAEKEFQKFQASVDSSVEALPSYAYDAKPDYKFRDEAPKPPQLDDSTEPLLIPSPYYMSSVVGNAPLYERIRQLFGIQNMAPAAPSSNFQPTRTEKLDNTPVYADYAGIEKLLVQMALNKVPKDRDIVRVFY